MSHPITYWVQTPAVDRLVEQYGAHLEELNPKTKADVLSYVIYQVVKKVDGTSSIALGRDARNFVKGESLDTLLLLIEAIAVQLRDQLREGEHLAEPIDADPADDGAPF